VQDKVEAAQQRIKAEASLYRVAACSYSSFL